MTEDNADRLTELETLVAHQAKTIDELNQTVRDQWAEIDKLTRSLTLIADKLFALEETARKGPPGSEPPPPHY